MGTGMSSKMVNFQPDLDRPDAAAAGGSLQDRVIAALKTVYDPELPVNIYDLGLIYETNVDADTGRVDVKMTLTAPACPVAGTMPGMVEQTIRKVEGVNEASVELVWDPPWTQDRMSEEARFMLDMF